MAGPLDTYNPEIMAVACRQASCLAPAGSRCRGNTGNSPTRAHSVRVKDAGFRYAALYVIERKAA